MARPEKKRKVCMLPKTSSFTGLGPESSFDKEALIMTVDEYETIRLIDYEGLNQEECSRQMKVGRATVQRVYSSARNKLALLLVEGEKLSIEGGKYELCGAGSRNCSRAYCHNK